MGRMGWGGCGDFLLRQRGEEEAIITQLWVLLQKPDGMRILRGLMLDFGSL